MHESSNKDVTDAQNPVTAGRGEGACAADEPNLVS